MRGTQQPIAGVRTASAVKWELCPPTSGGGGPLFLLRAPATFYDRLGCLAGRLFYYLPGRAPVSRLTRSQGNETQTSRRDCQEFLMIRFTSGFHRDLTFFLDLL